VPRVKQHLLKIAKAGLEALKIMQSHRHVVVAFSLSPVGATLCSSNYSRKQRKTIAKVRSTGR